MNRKIMAAALTVALLSVMLVTALAQSRKPDKEQAKDPVCGLMVDKNPELSATHKGETFYFCLRKDLEEFKKNPEKYGKR